MTLRDAQRTGSTVIPDGPTCCVFPRTAFSGQARAAPGQGLGPPVGNVWPTTLGPNGDVSLLVPPVVRNHLSDIPSRQLNDKLPIGVVLEYPGFSDESPSS